MRATALRQQALEVGRKALLSQASQMAGLTTTPEITALSYSTSRTKNSCTSYTREVKQGEFGKLHVKVTADGEVYDESDYDTISPSGWGNAQIQNIAMMPEATNYTVEISMAAGDEDKHGEVLAFGYTE